MRLGESVWSLVRQGRSRQFIQERQQALLSTGKSLFDYASWEYLFSTQRLPHLPSTAEPTVVRMVPTTTTVQGKPSIEIDDNVRAGIAKACHIYNMNFNIKEALMEIPPKQRRTLLLSNSGWAAQRIAREMGCSEKDVDWLGRMGARAVSWRQTGVTKTQLENAYGVKLEKFLMASMRVPVKVMLCSVLRRVRNLPIEDIADIMNISKSTVFGYSNQMNSALARGSR